MQYPYGAFRVVNDNGRSIDGAPSLWMADCVAAALKLEWDKPVLLNEVDIVFDTNLDRFKLEQIAPECVKSFVLEADGKEIYRKDDNTQRFVRCKLPAPLTVSELVLKITGTNGSDNARVVAIRCF
jgi:hypothetical protein